METSRTIELSRPASTNSRPDLARCKNRWNTALFLSILLGSLLGLAAMFTDILSWISGKPEEPARTGLIVIALVMLAFVSHCLDKLNETDCQIRQEQHQ